MPTRTCNDKAIIDRLASSPAPNGEKSFATELRVIKKLAPDQNGARRHRDRYGKALVCVRYREDDHQRYTTVEIVVAVRPLPQRATGIVGVAIGYHEADLRRLVKNAGGTWDHTSRLWKLPRNVALDLRLAERIRV